jgi:hypothetical protein
MVVALSALLFLTYGKVGVMRSYRLFCNFNREFTDDSFER